MNFRTYFVNYLLPGIGLLILAFYSGTQRNFLFALAGFLSFFIIGMTLIREGYKKYKG